MPTTVHIPEDLLASVDRRARDLGMSRNRYIIQALEKTLGEETRWSLEFLEALVDAAKDEASHQVLEEMVREIASRRSRKGPPSL